MLGPSLLGWVAPEVSALLFPAASLPALSVLGQFGIALFMFMVGWRLEIETLKSVGRMALVTSIVSIAVPFALGSAVAVFAWYPYAPQGVALLPFALFMGSAMSITAFPVLARILADQGLTRTRIGVLAMTCAAFNDAVGWLILAAITMIVVAGNMADAGGTLVGLAVVRRRDVRRRAPAGRARRAAARRVVRPIAAQPRDHRRRHRRVGLHDRCAGRACAVRRVPRGCRHAAR